MSPINNRFIVIFIILALFQDLFCGYDSIAIYKSPNNLVTVKLVGDIHNAPSEINKKHQSDQADLFTRFATQQSNTQLHIIAEDMTDCSDQPDNIKKYALDMRQQSEISPLAHVMDLCKKYNISASNAEYRFKRSAGLYCFYRNSIINESLSEEITTEDLLNEYNTIKNEILSYDDNASLGCYYTQLINNAHNAIAPMLSTLTFNDSINSYIKMEIPLHKRQSFARDFLHFDAAFIDARIIHTIYECMQKSMYTMQPYQIPIFAGKKHTAAIGIALLEKLNFKKERVIGTEANPQYSPVNLHTYFKPELSPIKLLSSTSQTRQPSYLDNKILAEYLLD
jgi:hypothetical protein